MTYSQTLWNSFNMYGKFKITAIIVILMQFNFHFGNKGQ